jgi:hypothetical protein
VDEAGTEPTLLEADPSIVDRLLLLLVVPEAE